MWRSLLLDTTEKMTQLRILFVEHVPSAFSRQCLAVLVSIQMDIHSVHKYQNRRLFYNCRGTVVCDLCTCKIQIKLLNIRCLHYALNSWKDQQNDNNWTACRSCQDSGGVNAVETCGVEGFRKVCWMGVGKLIHIHRRQDCLLNPLKEWSGWETLSCVILRRTFILLAGVFMADMITTNFFANEMSYRWGCGLYEMDEEFMRLLQILRDEMQGPLRVCIGRRSDPHNDRVSTAKNKKNGVYNLGQASNILTSGDRAMLIIEKVRKVGFSGIGLSQKGNHSSRFLHLDTLPRKALFRYWIKPWLIKQIFSHKAGLHLLAPNLLSKRYYLKTSSPCWHHLVHQWNLEILILRYRLFFPKRSTWDLPGIMA